MTASKTVQEELAWIESIDSLPCFVCYGFPTKREVEWQGEDGETKRGHYGGWGMFGFKDEEAVRWRPLDGGNVTLTSPHQHLDKAL